MRMASFASNAVHMDMAQIATVMICLYVFVTGDYYCTNYSHARLILLSALAPVMYNSNWP